MFDYDKWQEIFSTIRRNKLRTILTVFGVSWGIFMLIVLMGAGKGLENGVKGRFGSLNQNSVFLWSGRTTMPYDGLKPGRRLSFTMDDVLALQDQVPEAKIVIPRNQLGGGFGATAAVSRGGVTSGFSITGDYPEFMEIKKMDVYQGRFINFADLRDKRKIAVIGQTVRETLFKEDENPIGEYIKVRGVHFLVVGVHKSFQTAEQADGDNRAIFIPFTTFQQAFNFGTRVGWFNVAIHDDYKATDIEDKIKGVLMARHSVHPEDLRAVGAFNTQKTVEQISGVFTGIRIFVWIVGIGTLMAGIIGISNIMLIVVKERTKEIGVRKAMGATPWKIISLILQESIFLTTISGYLGLVVGASIIEFIGWYMKNNSLDAGAFGAPEINPGLVFSALVILIIGGALAGFIPAKKAASIEPIEALRNE